MNQDSGYFLTDFNRMGYSLRRYYVDRFHFVHVNSLKFGSSVLDLGGNRLIKRGKFNLNEYDFRVIYVNLVTEKGPDVQADAAKIPFAESKFDAAICSELLEHVPDPTEILFELSRVLKSGATLLICVPFLYPIHGDPYDFGRYTDHYWRNNLSLAGFKNVEIEWQGQFWSVSVDMFRELFFQMRKKRQPKSRFLRAAISTVIGYAKRLAISWDEKPNNCQNAVYGRFTTGFGINAVKR